MRSLRTKLIAAFGAVIGIGTFLLVVLFSGAAQSAFQVYTYELGTAWAVDLSEQLSTYYERTGSWEGAEALLVGISPGGGRGRGGQGEEQGMGSSSFWKQAGLQMMLADTDGAVLIDTGDTLPEDYTFDAEALARGVNVVINGEPAAVLVMVAAPDDDAGTAFLNVVNGVLVAFAVGTAGAALLATMWFVGRLTRPLNALERAAGELAGGEWGARVNDLPDDEIGRVGDAFNRMADALESAERSRRHMIADIAHELRTPLAILHGDLEAMLDGLIAPEPDEIQALHTEVLRLGRLVDDLRTLSLAEAGQLSLQIEAVDAADLLESVRARFDSPAAEKDVDLQVSAKTACFRADPDRLLQVLSNLVDNALRHTPEGGVITLGVEGRKLVVSDTGTGIPAEDLPHIFDRFWRAERSRSRETGGSGLGLAIAQQLVKAQGGSVVVISAPDEGTTFTTAMPAA